MNALRSKLQHITKILFLISMVLAPLKLGSMLLPGVPHGVPESVFEAVITSLSPGFFPLLAAVMLILSLVSFGCPAQLHWRTPAGKIVLFTCLLPLAALPGLINPDSYECGIIETEYLLGVAAYAAAAAIVLYGAGGDFKRKVLDAAAAGTLITALWGVHQYFFGFDDLREFIETQEKVYGVKISPELKARAYDVRVYATFTFASALAAFLCLTGCNAVARAVVWGKNFEPVTLSQKIFGVLSGILCAAVLLATKGRGAFLAVIVSAVFVGWVMIKSRKLKLLLALAALAAVIAGACYIHFAGRGFGSMTERVGYLKSSWQMVIEHPICGDGWGDFTFHHALNKSFGNEELAKDPHNMAAAFASQCGLFAGLAVLLWMLYPIWRTACLLRRRFDWEKLLLLFGLSAFSLHALMDLDWQVPALMMLYTVFMLSAVYEEDFPVEQTSYSKAALAAMSVLALLAAVGGWHFFEYDKRFALLKAAAGQELTANRQIAAAYEIDSLAQKILSVAPYSHSVYHAWGDDKFFRRDLAGAEELYYKALEMVPRSAPLYSRLGEIAKLRGDQKKAAEFAEKADQLFPHKKRFFEQQKSQGSIK